MAAFNLKKGDKFAINKGIQRIRVGLGWQASSKPGEAFDPDASMFGLIHAGGKPKFYGDGSHAVCYANTDLRKDPKDKSIHTADESIIHTGDNRTGGDDDSEQIMVALNKLPGEIDELSIFVTIYEAQKRQQDFGRINGCYIHVKDEDANQELCRYNLTDGHKGDTAVQVGSFMKGSDGQWAFQAVDAGSKADLGAVLAQYS